MAKNYIARQDGQWTVVSLTPDVCKTPMGPATPPSLTLSPPVWMMLSRLYRQSKRTDIRCWSSLKVSFPLQKAMSRVWLRE